MELILYPVIFVIQFVGELVVAMFVHILGFVFSRVFGKAKHTERSGDELQNPWQVFLFSMIGTSIIAVICAAISFSIYRTWFSVWFTMAMIGIFGFAASLSATDQGSAGKMRNK